MARNRPERAANPSGKRHPWRFVSDHNPRAAEARLRHGAPKVIVLRCRRHEPRLARANLGKLLHPQCVFPDHRIRVEYVQKNALGCGMTANTEGPLHTVRFDAIEEFAHVIDRLDHERDVIELLLSVPIRYVRESALVVNWKHA